MQWQAPESDISVMNMANSWLSILESSVIALRLRPYFKKIRKEPAMRHLTYGRLFAYRDLQK